MGWGQILIIILPILFAMGTYILNVPGWEMWGQIPAQQFPVISTLTERVFTPLAPAGLFLFYITQYFMALNDFPLIGPFIAFHTPYFIFAFYLALRYRMKPENLTTLVSILGTIVIYAVCLLLHLSMQGTNDPQAGLIFAMGLNVALLYGLTLSEVIHFIWSRKN